MSITQKQAQKLTAEPLHEAAMEELAHFARRCQMAAHFIIIHADEAILHSATHFAADSLH